LLDLLLILGLLGFLPFHVLTPAFWGDGGKRLGGVGGLPHAGDYKGA